jgi:uncharacterized membrane protein YfcA
MTTDGHHILYRELAWFAIAAPIFGVSCALLAKEWSRRAWLWFLLGFFFTINAILILVALHRYTKPSEQSRMSPQSAPPNSQ